LQGYERIVLLGHYTTFLYQVGINIYLADVVDDNGKTYALFIIKDAVKQGGLATAQITGYK
jgi:hypothetical protein